MTNASFNPSAIFFDLDGTLLDTAPDLAAAVNYAREKLLSMPPLPPELLRTAVTQGTRALVSAGTNLRDDHPMFQTFQDTMLDYYLAHVADLSKPFPGIEDLLDYLDQKHYDWGVITNKPKAFAEPLCRVTGLDDRAICLVCGDATNQPKPHPAHLLLAAQQHDYDPGRCIYIGDAKSDMQASQRAGMYGIAAAWGYSAPEEDVSCWGAAMIIQHPSELISWIKRS